MSHSVKVKSKYKENEYFDFRNTPKKFDSITNASIKQIGNHCLRNNEKEFKDKYEPSALKAMLTMVVGKFSIALSHLEGDYANRKGNLENAYNEGIAEVEAQTIAFRATVVEHNILFEQYSRANEKINGDKLPRSLIYKEADVDKIEKKCEELRKVM